MSIAQESFFSKLVQDAKLDSATRDHLVEVCIRAEIFCLPQLCQNRKVRACFVDGVMNVVLLRLPLLID